jgi:phosphoribosyl 1,2-cyclic phosphate phosphodiesterase
MKITVLGSGTSHGIPVIGCNCPVCTSQNPRNKRSRASITATSATRSLLIDTATDFRTQALRSHISHLDSVFLTHAHADHIHGLDDLRPLSYHHSIPIFGNRTTLDEVAVRFEYIFKKTQIGGGKPKIYLCVIDEQQEVLIGDMRIVPIPLKHGELDIFGYRINNSAYCTDCSFIPERSYELLQNLDLLIIGALRYTPHATHFSINQAVEVIERVKPRQARLTHLCHDVNHETLSTELPEGVLPAWDGEILDVQ